MTSANTVEATASPRKTVFDAVERTLTIDGKPFPWEILGLEITSGEGCVNQLTVTIPAGEITVRAVP